MNSPPFLHPQLLDNCSSNTSRRAPFGADGAGVALDKVEFRLLHVLRASGEVAAAGEDAIHLRDFV